MSEITTRKEVKLYKGNGNPDFVARKGSVYIKIDATEAKDRTWINVDNGTDWANFSTNK